MSAAIIPGDTAWPLYQNPPHGGFPLPEIGDHFLIPEESLYCSDCHSSAHGRAVVWSNSGYWNPATVTIDLSGATEEMCVGCHTTGMAFPTDALAPANVPQIGGAHGSFTGSTFTYQDLFDAEPKTEGGYDCSTCHGEGVTGGPGGISPHGGYDTTTNKCKVCHAVHRAEGAYYLLRADSQDDACSYCHIGGSAHSLKVVYDLNPAGIDTTNGHTIGAACSVPDSSVRQYAEEVTLNGVDCDGNAISEVIDVRAYDETKLQMYRLGRHHGQSDEGTGRSGYAKIGPLNLRCMNCHQTHNAIDEVWRPLAWAGTAWPNPVQNLSAFEATGYKLLKRYPSATTTGAPGAEGYYNPGQQIKAIEGNAVPFGETGPWGVETGNFSKAYSAAFTYNQNAETAAAPIWIAQDIHEPDVAAYPTAGTGYYRYPYFNSKYALSWWCADCHNLNVGGWEPLADPELGFKAHTERTHPAPFYGAYTGPGQCYSCHRNDLSAKMGSINTTSNPASVSNGRATVTGRDSCTQCHYGTKDYAIEMGNEDVAGTGTQPDLGLDFPHSGRTTDIKLLGSYTINAPAGGYAAGNFPGAGGTPATGASTYMVPASISESNLDAVCLRCHPGVGVHQ